MPVSADEKKRGYMFELDADEEKHRKQVYKNTEPTRKSEIFIIEDEAAMAVPESIDGSERLPNVAELSLFRLEKLPIKGLKIFLYSALTLLVILSAFEVVRVFHYALSLHWIVASLYSFLLAVVAGLGLRLVYRYIKDSENLSVLGDIQDKADRLIEGNDFGQAAHFIEELRSFYQGKPQAEYFERCIQQLPDYSNDREALQHINTIFIKPLDEEAIRRISDYCVQSGVVVALSPWASLDMFFSLWRSVRMVDDIGQVYGVRPSLPNRLRLLRKVMHQLLFVGATELVMDTAMAEMGIQSLGAKLSVRAGQGLGAGFYTAKIGVAAMQVSRPIAFKTNEKPKLSRVAGEMVSKVKSLFVSGNTH